MMDIYFDNGNEITTGSFKLQGIGRDIWLMLNGKNTIRCIVEKLCTKLVTDEKDAILNELLMVLRMLNKRNAIVINWDPIYKMLRSQRLHYEE